MRAGIIAIAPVGIRASVKYLSRTSSSMKLVNINANAQIVNESKHPNIDM